MFCPKCGSILMPKIVKGKKGMGCACGYSTKDVVAAKIKESIRGKKTKIEIIEKEDITHLPIIDTECPKCEHKKAYYWTVQTRAGDEPETKFLKCVKCKHTWRDYN